MPLWLTCFLGLGLAVLCIGTTWLVAASIADPELYAQVTDPVKAYVSKQMDALEEEVGKMNAAIDQSIDNAKDYVQEKQEEISASIAEKKEEKAKAEAEANAPDAQALSDAALAIPREQADSLTTHLSIDTSGQEILTGGAYDLFYYNQTDPQWGQYGTDSISGYGCGPTAASMVVSTISNLLIDPQEMSNIFVREEYWCKSSGTYYHFADGVGELFQLKVESYTPEEITAGDLINQLVSGKIAIALMTNGHFTTAGHFIVLHGATLSGDILVADPASRERTLTTWDPQLILDELSPTRLNGAPLWFFSPEEEEALIPDLEG